MNKEHETQIDKYGGVEGYKAEMRRRRSLVKDLRPGFKYMDKAKLKEVSAKGGKGYAKNKTPKQKVAPRKRTHKIKETVISEEELEIREAADQQNKNPDNN